MLAFAFAHASSGHQFQDQPVSDFFRPENALIGGILFDDVPAGDNLWTGQFPQLWCIPFIISPWMSF
jgi:hypothetical protein